MSSSSARGPRRSTPRPRRSASVLAADGAGQIGVLGGARGTNEDAYVWARFAKGVLRTDNVDAQLGDGLPAEVALGLPHATIADLDRARGIVVLGVDPKEELPVLYLRARRAAAELGVPLIDIAPTATGLTPYAAASIRYAPGRAGRGRGRAGRRARWRSRRRRRRRGRGRRAGRPRRRHRGDRGSGQPRRVGRRHRRRDRRRSPALDGTRFLVALRRGNVRGALDLGLAPGFLPGRVDARGRPRLVRGRVGCGARASPGLDAHRDPRAPRPTAGIGALVLLGADPHGDCPDRALAAAGVTGARFVIAVDTFLTESSGRADVFLPVTTWGEQDGTVTNIEGPGAAGRAQGVARRHRDARLADRRRARAAAARGLRPRDRRRGPGRDRAGRAGVRRRHEHARAPRRATASCCRSPSTPTRSSSAASSIPLTDASWEPIVPGQVDGGDPRRGRRRGRRRRDRGRRGRDRRRDATRPPRRARRRRHRRRRRRRLGREPPRAARLGGWRRPPRAGRGGTPTLCAS